MKYLGTKTERKDLSTFDDIWDIGMAFNDMQERINGFTTQVESVRADLYNRVQSMTDSIMSSVIEITKKIEQITQKQNNLTELTNEKFKKIDNDIDSITKQLQSLNEKIDKLTHN